MSIHSRIDEFSFAFIKLRRILDSIDNAIYRVVRRDSWRVTHSDTTRRGTNICIAMSKRLIFIPNILSLSRNGCPGYF